MQIYLWHRFYIIRFAPF